ncbi:MAG: hypothetical protein Q8911_00250 [Bacillota bacterium]|nr:hypothetical protein [Bacillota bacterium]
MNVDKRRKAECFTFDCKYAETRCIVFHGNDCVKLGGNKIPVMRSLGNPKPKSEKPSLIKPKFVNLEGWDIESILRSEVDYA